MRVGKIDWPSRYFAILGVALVSPLWSACGQNGELAVSSVEGALCVGGGTPIQCPGTTVRKCPDLCPGPTDPPAPPRCGTQPPLPSDPELGAGWVVHAAAPGGPRSVNYNQLPAHTKYNGRSCLSGCGGTAWAMLGAWTDYQQRGRAYAEHWDAGRWLNEYWITTSFGRPYQDTFATQSSLSGALVQNASWDDNWSRLTGGFSSYMDSKCISSEAFTDPKNMPYGGDYIKSWGARIEAHSDFELSPNHVNTGRYLEDVRNWIDNYHVPVILGFEELADSHYELVSAYARQVAYTCSGNSTWQLKETGAWKIRVNHGWGDDVAWDNPPGTAWAAYTFTVLPPAGAVHCEDGSVGPELYRCPACAPNDPLCSHETEGTILPFCHRECCGETQVNLPCCVHPFHGAFCGEDPTNP
jgi:hypothetical protein